MQTAWEEAVRFPGRQLLCLIPCPSCLASCAPSSRDCVLPSSGCNSSLISLSRALSDLHCHFENLDVAVSIGNVGLSVESSGRRSSSGGLG